MPDMNLMSIMAIGNGTDAANVLSNNVTRTQPNRNLNGNGEDFSTVIDQTAMSIMAGAVMQPASVTGLITPPQAAETRPFATVETTARTLPSRGNDYTQQTQMAEGQNGNRTGGLEARTEGGFSEGLQTAVDTATEQMTTETAEQLQVSEEEVENALFALNLAPEALLTEEGLTDVVMQVTGEDSGALLTDENLYNGLRTLVGEADVLKADIAEEAGVTLADVEQMIETKIVSPLIEAEPMSGEAPEVQEAQIIAPVQTTQQMPREAHEEEIREEAPQAARETQNALPQEAPVQQAENEQGRNTQQNFRREAQAGEEVRTDTQQAAQTVSVAEGFLNSVNEALAGQAAYTGGTEGQVSAQDVMRQVLDHLRSEVREGMTELEMQLNPQSLGRVHVTLQAMDSGEMVARFAAQNEQVKEALANQMPELLQRFEEQGIKVNEIEVTVAQQGYNEQREGTQAGEDRQQEQEAAIARMGRLRRVQIDLASMDAEEIAALDDDARIEAEMMAAEGNTVNYRA